MKAVAFSLLVSSLFRLWIMRSHTYLDPGSGSMLLQVLLGGLAGLAVMLRLIWHRLGSLLRFGKTTTDAAGTSDDA